MLSRVDVWVVDASEELSEMLESSVWRWSACEGSRREGLIECGDMSSGGCDASASADSAEGFGCEVEARRSSHVRFSACNLKILVSPLLVEWEYWTTEHTAQVLPPTAATSRRFVYSSDSAS